MRHLLERANRLQEAGEPERSEEGVTLAELQEAAAESLVERVTGCALPEYERLRE